MKAFDSNFLYTINIHHRCNIMQLTVVKIFLYHLVVDRIKGVALYPTPLPWLLAKNTLALPTGFKPLLKTIDMKTVGTRLTS